MTFPSQLSRIPRFLPLPQLPHHSPPLCAHPLPSTTGCSSCPASGPFPLRVCVSLPPTSAVQGLGLESGQGGQGPSMISGSEDEFSVSIAHRLELSSPNLTSELQINVSNGPRDVSSFPTKPSPTRSCFHLQTPLPTVPPVSTTASLCT